MPFLITALVVAVALLGWLNDVGGGLPPFFSLVLDRASTFGAVFLSIFFEAAPFLLLGAFGSGLVEEFISQDDLARWLPRAPLGAALSGGLLGLFFPVCECGVVPFARRLLRKGLSLTSGVSVLLASPVVNPIVIISTLTAFGPGLIFWGRMGFSFVIAVGTGLVFSRLSPPAALRADVLAAPVLQSPPARPPALGKRLEHVLVIGADEFFEIGRYLVIGALLAALMQTFVPQPALLAVGRGPILSVLVLLFLAVLLSICSTVDAFIALAFVGVFSPGAILAFLVFGPMVDIKSTLMYLRIFKRKTTALLVLLPFLGAFTAGVAVNLLLK